MKVAPHKRRRAIELVEHSGLSRAAAAAAVGVSRQAVARWCREAGLPCDPQSRAHDPAFVEQVVQTRAKGLSFSQVGAALGVKKNVIAGVLFRLRHRA